MKDRTVRTVIGTAPWRIAFRRIKTGSRARGRTHFDEQLIHIYYQENFSKYELMRTISHEWCHAFVRSNFGSTFDAFMSIFRIAPNHEHIYGTKPKKVSSKVARHPVMDRLFGEALSDLVGMASHEATAIYDDWMLKCN